MACSTEAGARTGHAVNSVVASRGVSRSASTATPITNALTIDVEDYFQVSAFAKHVRRSDWDSMECRVEQNVDRILAMLAQARSTATFFTLGWIAEPYYLSAMSDKLGGWGWDTSQYYRVAEMYYVK